MQERVFIPKYPPGRYIPLIILIPILLFAGVKGIVEGDFNSGVIFALLMCVVLIVFILSVFIAAITFSTSCFTIERYLLPDKTIDYNDIVMITHEIIKTRRGILFIQFMKNSDELIGILRKHQPKERTGKDQDHGEQVEQEPISPLAVVLPFILSLGIWGLIYFSWPYDKSLINVLITPLVVLTSILLFRVLKDRI